MGSRAAAPAISVLSEDREAALSLGRACGVGPTVAQLLLQRGYADATEASAFLDPRLSDLTPPDQMAGRQTAADRIASAIRRRERIVVFGDYDVDGTTAAVILAEVIETLGGDVHVLCADRFSGGYGLSDSALDRCLERSPRLLITCDCGSSDHARIERAMKHGADVIVVDHHLVPKEPLPALAFLNPHRPDCGFAYKGLASAGLAFSIAAALRTSMGVDLDVRQWLDLVALGTVADVAPLDGDNRRLVRAGLRLLARDRPRPGVRALRQLAKLGTVERLSAIDIGFRLAPRLNAPGRLGKTGLTLELLRAKDHETAFRVAQEIHALNEERKRISARMEVEAIAQVRDVYGEAPKGGIVVASEAWHRGVVGITAARLVSRFKVPALVVAFDGAIGHGSGRTVPGFDVHAALGKCASIVEGWGGHRAAVGFSLRHGQLDAFRSAFADATGTVEPLPDEVAVDVELGERFPPPSAKDFAKLEPLGEGNPVPRFLSAARVLKAQAVGGDGAHLSLEINVAGQTMRAFAPNLGGRAGTIGERVTVIGQLRHDHFRGGDQLELLVQNLW